MRWIAIDLVTIVAAWMIFKYIYDFVYTWDSISVNRQHFANIHWLKMYRNALKG